MSCIFCKIAKKEIAAKIVFENQEFVAFHDIDPQAPVHILLIPRHHYSSLSATTDPEILQKLLSIVQQIARQLKLENYRVVINNGSEAGQSVFHLHLHILSGRKMNWPPG